MAGEAPRVEDASPFGTLSRTSASGVYSPRSACDCRLVTIGRVFCRPMEKPQGVHECVTTCLSLSPSGWLEWRPVISNPISFWGQGHHERKGGGLEERGEEVLGG